MEEAHWFDSNGYRLFGILHRATEERGVILLLHGFTGNHTGTNYSFVTLARELCERGFSVFRFDYMGSGDSEGEFVNQRFSTCIQDVKNALAYLNEKNVNTSHVGVMGHSMGGSVALVTAGDIGADAVVTWATVAAYSDVWPESYSNILKKQDEVTFFGFRTPTAKLMEFLEYDLADYTTQIEVPTLFVHGAKDNTVPVSHAERLYNHASGPKELLLLEHSDHLFTDPDDRTTLIQQTADWFDY